MATTGVLRVNVWFRLVIIGWWEGKGYTGAGKKLYKKKRRGILFRTTVFDIGVGIGVGVGESLMGDSRIGAGAGTVAGIGVGLGIELGLGGGDGD